jgi:hypothetical protein
MAHTITFSRGKLGDFLACQRRFQLRYQRQLAWPVGPLGAEKTDALERGRRFHELLHRHFLGLPVAEPDDEDKALSLWWRLFQAQGPRLPEGRRLPEFALTVPIGRHFLTGRFDLLIVGLDGLHVYDWKTGIRSPRPAALGDDLQTRVYLALAAEGAPALWPDRRPESIRPEFIRLTYWYASDPPESRSLAYDGAWHAENWAYLSGLVQQIEGQLASGADLPLTDDLAQCRRCAYQAYCGRQADGLDLDEWLATTSPRLEPDLP